MTSEEQRILDVSIEVDAPASAVWRALTEADELTRWFPPMARVVPGVGGSIFLSWGEGVEGTATIEIWEPNRKLRVVEGPMAIDYLIEARGEATVLRIVHSGFGADASFDDQYDATLGGWSYFLYNLKHYLERHRGQPRHMISVRLPLTGTREEAWPDLIGEGGLQLSMPGTEPGSPYRMRLGNRTYSGSIIAVRPARSFAGTVSELNDGLLFVELESGGERWHCGLWLSVYGAQPDVDVLRQGLAAVVARRVAVEAR